VCSAVICSATEKERKGRAKRWLAGYTSGVWAMGLRLSHNIMGSRYLWRLTDERLKFEFRKSAAIFEGKTQDLGQNN
jgi:hypothetical protein